METPHAAIGRTDRVVDAVTLLNSNGIWSCLLSDVEPATAAGVSQAVQVVLEPDVMPDGLLRGSGAWLVTASRPWH